MYLKYLSFIPLVALAFNLAGQQLPQGKFVLSTGFTYTEFNFKSYFKFDYKYSSCTGGEEGSGTYSFRNRELTLTFDNPKDKHFPSMSITKELTQNDTSHLSFNFYDPKDTSPVAGVFLEYQYKSTSNRTISNLQGNANLKILNNQFPVEIKVAYIGYNPETIIFDSNGVYTISYPLNFSFTKQLTKGHILKFVVDNFDDDELVLKPINEKEFRIFQRKEE
jgi:hypothetical protein